MVKADACATPPPEVPPLSGLRRSTSSDRGGCSGPVGLRPRRTSPREAGTLDSRAMPRCIGCEYGRRARSRPRTSCGNRPALTGLRADPFVKNILRMIVKDLVRINGNVTPPWPTPSSDITTGERGRPDTGGRQLVGGNSSRISATASSTYIRTFSGRGSASSDLVPQPRQMSSSFRTSIMSRTNVPRRYSRT